MIIRTKAIGQRKPLFADFAVSPPDVAAGGGPLRLRDLIDLIVRQQVEQFNERQERGRFDRVLSQRQIDAGTARGRIAPEGRQIDQNVDPDEAVEAAFQAFEDGLYLVVIDEQEYRDLDAFVRISEQSRIVFIRLTFLAGA